MFRTVDRKTPYILPLSMDDWLPKDHPARFIVEVVSMGIRSLRSLGPLVASFLRIRHTDLFEPSDRGGHLRFRGLPLHRGGSHPDHDTIATFGKRPLGETDAFFVQILQIAHQMGSRKVGTVSRDGTKVKANASKHRALSHRHAGKLRKQLEPEVRDSDQVNLTDGQSRIMLT